MIPLRRLAGGRARLARVGQSLDRRTDRLGERVEVVAALEAHQHWDLELGGELPDGRGHVRERRRVERALRERVGSVCVVPGRDREQIGPVLAGDRDDDALDEGEEIVGARPRGEPED